MADLSRREFLRAGAGVAASAAIGTQVGWLAGCGGGGPAHDWQGLAKRLQGRLVRPGDRSYTQISRPLNGRYASIRPQGVSLCASADDVRESVVWARESGLPVAVRSGGHNYAGYSTGPGLVINVGGMREIDVSDGSRLVTAQPGARNTMIYDGLQPHGVAISAGRCPTVAVGGLVLGGGIGFSSRRLGLTCDHLAEARIVTAAGKHLRCSEAENRDLFWALRGGGSGNFGVCTSYTFETRPVDDVTIYDIAWEWDDAPAVLSAFQRVMRGAPDDFSARIGVGRPGVERTAGAGPPVVSALGQFFGPKRDLLDLLEPAMKAGKVKSKLIERRTFWKAKDYFYANVPHTAYAVKSDYLDEPLGDQGIAKLLASVDRWPGSSNDDGAGAAIFASGGAINRVPATATAFVHRSQFGILATESTWTERDSESTVRANVEWLDSLAEQLRPHVSGSAYQNFIDRGQPDWQRAYYGENFDRLVEVKRRYDPDGLFDYEQGIPSRS